MGRGRGRGRKNLSGPPRKNAKSKDPVTDNPSDDVSSSVPVVGNPTKLVADTVMRRLKKSLPATEEDDDPVTCSECGKESDYRSFRLHNIQNHMNTALTAEEKTNPELTIDHKYFSRRLNEFKKLTNATDFRCPKSGCGASYKSTLGLAYHLNTCGRTAEELEAVLLECEICHVKCTLPNMQWHRKTHVDEGELTASSEVIAEDSVRHLGVRRKRASAVRAQKTFRKGKRGDVDDADEYRGSEGSESDSGAGYIIEDANAKEKGSSQPSKASKSTVQLDRDTNDYCCYALNFLEELNSEGRTWDDPSRNDEDFWDSNTDNKFQSLEDAEIDQYLPTHKESVEFKYISDDGSSNFHKLTWFEGETVSSHLSTISSLHHTGGPVLSMSWHPSGKLLAVSVGRDSREDIDLLKCQSRPSCVQIYSSSSYNLSLKLVIPVEWGYANHIQWNSFCPDIMDSYNPSSSTCFEDIEIFCRIGYLAMACEDASIRIMSIRIEDLKLPPNYEYKHGFRVRVYSKTPEVCLRLDESVIEDDLSNVSKFEWHEKNQFLVAGYANGTIALFDVKTPSPLLVEQIKEVNREVTVIYPFWTFVGHRLAVRGICFDPTNPRFFASAGQDRCIKVWDTHTRMERDFKKAGVAVDMCWIRGWIHQAVSFECHLAHCSTMHNYVRIYPIGSSVGRPTSAETHNFTSLDFYHGLTAQGTDDGNVGVTYFDGFWRECDYDRNKKKKNLVILSSISVDSSSYKPISNNNIFVEIKKLAKSVRSSKSYQRLGINEDDGIYSVTLESRFGGSDIYDPIPNVESIDEEEIEDLDETIESENGIDKEAAILDSISAISEPKVNDGFLPVYDVNIPEETPKIVFSFKKLRPNTAVPPEGINDQKLEEYVRFQPYIRINKVSWSPDGNVIAVGYRNGLVSLLPGKFDSIFSLS